MCLRVRPIESIYVYYPQVYIFPSYIFPIYLLQTIQRNYTKFKVCARELLPDICLIFVV